MLDFLIVGQGLAGTVLSATMADRGLNCMVIDDKHHSAASKVAAGLINPITGHRYVKSWMIDQLIPEAIDTYQKLSSLLDVNLVHQLNVIRALTSIKHENDWYARYEDNTYRTYMQQRADLSTYQKHLKAGFQYGEICNSFRIDVQVLIRKYKAHLIHQSQIILESFDFDSLQITDDHISYKGLKANHIVFCEGFKVIKNPFFSNLPFEPVKGEVVRFSSDQLPTDKILRHAQYIVPMADKSFWSGGGFDHKNLNDLPTGKYLKEWKKDMSSFLITPFNILKQEAGVRPSIKGRRPVIGQHAEIKKLWIFNGMGTKGTSLSPYCANRFVDYYLDKTEIPTDISINRFH